jgi:hypothetical protein
VDQASYSSKEIPVILRRVFIGECLLLKKKIRDCYAEYGQRHKIFYKILWERNIVESSKQKGNLKCSNKKKDIQSYLSPGKKGINSAQSYNKKNMLEQVKECQIRKP